MKSMRFECEQIRFLGVSTKIPWELMMSEPMKIWEKLYSDQTMERLLQVCQANKVYSLCCMDCNQEEKTVTYSIVCENRAGASSDEFTPITVEASEYIAFHSKGSDPLAREKVYEELYHEAYREWLPTSSYEAVVAPLEHKSETGFAVIESVMPADLASTNYVLELWIPVKKIK